MADRSDSVFDTKLPTSRLLMFIRPSVRLHAPLPQHVDWDCANIVNITCTVNYEQLEYLLAKVSVYQWQSVVRGHINDSHSSVLRGHSGQHFSGCGFFIRGQMFCASSNAIHVGGTDAANFPWFVDAPHPLSSGRITRCFSISDATIRSSIRRRTKALKITRRNGPDMRLITSTFMRQPLASQKRCAQVIEQWVAIIGS